MIAYTSSKLEHIFKLEFVRFCIVGGTGFMINFFLLAILPKVFGLPLLISQFIGAEVALFSNFMLHHHWTYKSHKVDKSMKSLIIQFHATSWPAVLGSTVMVYAGVRLLHLNKLEALAISSAIALVWNYAWSKFVIWRDVTPKEVEEIAT